MRDLYFGSAAAGEERVLLDKAAHDTVRVVEGALSLVEDELVRAADNEGDGVGEGRGRAGGSAVGLCGRGARGRGVRG